MSSRLLVIDDETATLEFIERAAAPLGYDVRVTRDAAEFMALCRTFDPDVIVLDIVMPEMDGFDLIKFLVEQKYGSHLVLISGHDPMYLKGACAVATDRGLKSVTPLPKPFDLAQIEALLRGFI